MQWWGRGVLWVLECGFLLVIQNLYFVNFSECIFYISKKFTRQRDNIVLCIFSWDVVFFLRKVSPELTSAANPPLFAEEDWPWTNIVPIFLYFICGMPATAWLAKGRRVCTEDLNHRTLGRRSGTCELNCCATRPATPITFLLWNYFRFSTKLQK